MRGASPSCTILEAVRSGIRDTRLRSKDALGDDIQQRHRVIEANELLLITPCLLSDAHTPGAVISKPIQCFKGNPSFVPSNFGHFK